MMALEAGDHIFRRSEHWAGSGVHSLAPNRVAYPQVDAGYRAPERDPGASIQCPTSSTKPVQTRNTAATRPKRISSPSPTAWRVLGASFCLLTKVKLVLSRSSTK